MNPEQVKIYKSLGHPVRYCIASMLSRTESANVGEIQCALSGFNISHPAVSQHLQRMKKDGLLQSANKHRNVIYSMSTEVKNKLESLV